ncbi:MAG: AMP-dependent synthetase [Ruminococcaceae bacterium]|nr:AMP-dependent synthetase [Oscillospiraceae bacterium]
MWDFSAQEPRIALRDDRGNTLTYEEMQYETDRLAAATGGRCLVFSLCRNEIGSIMGYAAFVNHGIVPLLLSSRLEDSLLRNLIDTYAPSYLWIPEDQSGRFADMEAVYSAHGYALMKTARQEAYPLNDALGLLLTTSGSTGSPKLVRQSYVNIIDNAQSIVKYLELDAEERPITTLPMNYTYGLSIINSHLLAGATILVTDKDFTQRGFWDFFREAGATSFGGVPYTYEMLDRMRFYRMELPSLRTMTQAGGKILPDIQEKFAKYAVENDKRFFVMYGACEATARMGYLPAEMALVKKGSVGIAIPGGRFRLIDGDEREITDPNVVGELIYEGKNVTLGYAECGADLNRGDECHGVLKTGDMAYFDEDGFFYISGRKKRFLKIFGNRVNLDEMERLIRGRFNVDAACTGIDDRLSIFTTEETLMKPIQEYAAAVTRLNPSAFRVIHIDEIPKNDSGKTLYSALEQYNGL